MFPVAQWLSDWYAESFMSSTHPYINIIFIYVGCVKIHVKKVRAKTICLIAGYPLGTWIFFFVQSHTHYKLNTDYSKSVSLLHRFLYSAIQQNVHHQISHLVSPLACDGTEHMMRHC